MAVMTDSQNRLPLSPRRHQIVQTVLKLVAKHGADAVTAQLIADMIGLSQPAVFRHFPTKEALWVAVLDWLDDQLSTIHRRAEGDAGTPALDVLGRMFFAHVALIERHPALAKIVFSDHLRLQYSSLNPRFAEILDAYQARVIELIKRAKTNGEAAVAVAPRSAATLYFCMIQGLGFQAVIARLPIKLQRNARQLFALYRRALE
jgi:AcrR family transcriptional regulator